MKNFRLYNRIITDIEKGVFYYEIKNGEKDSNNEFIVHKIPVNLEDIPEYSKWEEEFLLKENLLIPNVMECCTQICCTQAPYHGEWHTKGRHTQKSSSVSVGS